MECFIHYFRHTVPLRKAVASGNTHKLKFQGLLLVTTAEYMSLLINWNLYLSNTKYNGCFTLGQRSSNYGPPATCFFQVKFDGNIVALIHLCIVCGCFCATRAKLDSHDRDCISPKAQNVYFQVFYRRCSLTPVLEQPWRNRRKGRKPEDGNA